MVDTPGDNILAEFSGALNAVNSAIEIQQKLAIDNGKLPSNRRMDFRIGINLGDVLHEETGYTVMVLMLPPELKVLQTLAASVFLEGFSIRSKRKSAKVSNTWANTR